MAAPLYSAADYLHALQALLPRGKAWPRGADTTLTRALAGLTPTFAAQNARANQLLVEANPTTTNELLPEWEATLGLPSPAAGPAPLMASRQLLVALRFVSQGGQSAAYIQQYAAALGYTVTVQNQAPFRCGQSRCGQTLGTPQQVYAWTVSAPSQTDTVFGAYGDAVLKSELQNLAPAHTVLTVQTH